MIAVEKIMPAGWILFGLKFFAISAVVALDVAVWAPIPGVRLLGWIALFSALAGLALHACVLHVADPRAWTALRQRVTDLRQWARAALHRRRSIESSP